MEQGFRGNCDSQGKLGMCPSLTESYASGFSKISRRQSKVFWSNNFSKMLARFRASSPDRCPQAAKSPCHAFGTRRGWWEKRPHLPAARILQPLSNNAPYWFSINRGHLFRCIFSGAYSFSSKEATCFKICCSVVSSLSGSGVGVGSGSGSVGCIVFVKPFNPAFCIIVG